MCRFKFRPLARFVGSETSANGRGNRWVEFNNKGKAIIADNIRQAAQAAERKLYEDEKDRTLSV